MSHRQWSDSTLLRRIKNPSTKPYEIKIKAPEITFLGVKNQPDFARMYAIIYPKEAIVELKSLKIYLQQFRNQIVSYERLINVIYDDLISVYKPERLRLVIDFNCRGGISSRLTVDSDWKDRGGKEKYSGWVEDVW